MVITVETERGTSLEAQHSLVLTGAISLSEIEINCVFCRIATHEAPARIRYEDADLVAFDAVPGATPLHVLVVPRRHIRSVADLADIELAGRLVLAACRIASEAGAKSFRLTTNSGAPLQDVLHLHWHVMAGGEMGHPAGIAFARGQSDASPASKDAVFDRMPQSDTDDE